MLQNLSQQIRDCYQHAEECRRRAIAQADPELRKDFLELKGAGLSSPAATNLPNGWRNFLSANACVKVLR
jgi:hypothetical protein